MEAYSYKQILLSLREEYLKNQKRLNALKKYISLDTKKQFEEYDFYVFNEGRDKYLELALTERQSAIVKLIESISNKIVGDDEKKTINIAHEFNGEMRYLTIPNSKNYSINDFNSLMADADKILGCEFVQKISNPRIRLEDKDFILKINPANIAITTGEHIVDYVPARLLYTPTNDQLSIIAFDDPLYMEHINNIFNRRIPAELLGEYHRSIIEKSESKDKELSIQGVSLSKVPQYYNVIEGKNSVLLKRVR